jgi:RNA-directed DNA polymerase
MKAQVRMLTGRTRGCSIPTVVAELRGYLLGWKAYFRLADTPGVFMALDQWLRRRLRVVYLKQWKRGVTAFRELRARGVSQRVAAQAASHARRWWFTAHHAALHIALPTRYLDQLGVPRLAG